MMAAKAGSTILLGTAVIVDFSVDGEISTK
jgi:hypothetical protein